VFCSSEASKTTKPSRTPILSHLRWFNSFAAILWKPKATQRLVSRSSDIVSGIKEAIALQSINGWWFDEERSKLPNESEPNLWHVSSSHSLINFTILWSIPHLSWPKWDFVQQMKCARHRTTSLWTSLCFCTEIDSSRITRIQIQSNIFLWTSAPISAKFASAATE